MLGKIVFQVDKEPSLNLIGGRVRAYNFSSEGVYKWAEGTLVSIESGKAQVIVDTTSENFSSSADNWDLVVAGERGSVGPTGLPGTQGKDGPQGPIGKDGPQGPTGPQGVQGHYGIDGPEGKQGKTGEQGIQGPIGPVGLTGPQGKEGPQGPIGIDGPEGPEGPQGPKGDDGKAQQLPVPFIGFKMVQVATESDISSCLAGQGKFYMGDEGKVKLSLSHLTTDGSSIKRLLEVSALNNARVSLVSKTDSSKWLIVQVNDASIHGTDIVIDGSLLDYPGTLNGDVWCYFASFAGSGGIGPIGLRGVPGPKSVASVHTSMDISIGIKQFNVQNPEEFAIVSGAKIRLARQFVPNFWMDGQVLYYVDKTGEVGFQVQQIQGSGSFDKWFLSPIGEAGPVGPAGPIGPPGPAGPIGPVGGSVGYGTSTTNLPIGNGLKKLTINEKTSIFVSGTRVRVVRPYSSNQWMEGLVYKYDPEICELTLMVNLFSGSGDFSLWNVSVVGTQGNQGQKGESGIPVFAPSELVTVIPKVKVASGQAWSEIPECHFDFDCPVDSKIWGILTADMPFGKEGDPLSKAQAEFAVRIDTDIVAEIVAKPGLPLTLQFGSALRLMKGHHTVTALWRSTTGAPSCNLVQLSCVALVGAQGPRGEKGEKGEAGPAGGPPGPRGATGMPGIYPGTRFYNIGNASQRGGLSWNSVNHASEIQSLQINRYSVDEANSGTLLESLGNEDQIVIGNSPDGLGRNFIFQVNACVSGEGSNPVVLAGKVLSYKGEELFNETEVVSLVVLRAGVTGAQGPSGAMGAPGECGFDAIGAWTYNLVHNHNYIGLGDAKIQDIEGGSKCLITLNRVTTDESDIGPLMESTQQGSKIVIVQRVYGSSPIQSVYRIEESLRSDKNIIFTTSPMVRPKQEFGEGVIKVTFF